MTKPELTSDQFNERAMAADPSPEKALFWLSYYADDIGNAFGKMKHADLRRKTVRAIEYDYAKKTMMPKPSNTDCMMAAERSQAYVDACEDLQNAAADYMRLDVLKEAAILKITLYQSKLKHANRGHPS